MIIELFVLCDAATDQQGKLNILGAFDGLFGKNFPIAHPQCALASRVRFLQSEQGEHKISIDFIDADGKFVIPRMEGNLNFMIPQDQDSMAVNLIFNLNRVQFEKPGVYEINLLVDEKQQASIPLRVKETQ